MANREDNIKTYATNYFNFNETTGNVLDSKGTAIGTPTSITRVNGYNGNAVSFNGTSSYITFNQKVIPIGAKSIRFKIKRNGVPTSSEYFMSNINTFASGSGIACTVDNNENIGIGLGNATANRLFLVWANVPGLFDGKWHDILFTWDGTTNLNAVKLYVDNMNTPVATTTSIGVEVNEPTLNLTLGRLGTGTNWFKGELDEIEIYNRVISTIPDKSLFKDGSSYKYYSISDSQFKNIGSNITEETYLNLGIEDISIIDELSWNTLSGNVELLTWSDFQPKNEIQYSIETNPFTLSDELGSTFSVIEYTDNTTQEDSVITTETEPYSVYDHISETPEVLVYTEFNDDITIETTTEPFNIYDEFGEEVEVLHYTDDESVTETDLILEADYSPIDELDGDFEVVTWTNEVESERLLEVNGTISPKFIHQLNQITIGELIKILVSDNTESKMNNSNIRYLFSPDNINWYNFKNNEFNRVNISDINSIKYNGNTALEILTLTDEQLKTWSFDKINVGVYMEDDIRDNSISKIGNSEITHESYVDSPIITGNSLYILNTTALIDIELIGNSVFGELSDEDMTRVQYRVKLNGQPYFPIDGEYTSLADSPQAISINFTSSEIKIDDWNDVVIEFKDYFGKEDSWSASFIGRYSGILFKDENGEDYSTDVGAILKYLDFGTVITGQYSPIYKVMLKNTYGFDVTDLKLEANTEGFPEGLVVEFSDNEAFNDPVSSLVLGNLANDGEIPFYIRMNSPIDTQPNGANYFDIYVSAKRDV